MGPKLIEDDGWQNTREWLTNEFNHYQEIKVLSNTAVNTLLGVQELIRHDARIHKENRPWAFLALIRLAEEEVSGHGYGTEEFRKIREGAVFLNTLSS